MIKHRLIAILFIFTNIYTSCKNTEIDKNTNIQAAEEIKTDKENENQTDNNENNGVVNVKNRSMYNRLYDNIELSPEEKKLIGIEEEKVKYTKDDAKFTTFYDIKYGQINWKNIPEPDVTKADIYDNRDKNLMIQTLGIYGSSSCNLIPEKIDNIGTSFGYNTYDIYKRKDNDIRFFDTKMPIGDVRGIFNLDSDNGFITKIKTYYSANEKMHLGLSLDLILRKHALISKTESKYNLAVINFPISSYFLYKSSNEKLLWLINIDIYNFNHYDNGGVAIDKNPKYIYEEKIKDRLDNMLSKRLTNGKILSYIQYKFKHLYLYGQYNLNAEENTFKINNNKETKVIEENGRNKRVTTYDKAITKETISTLFKSNETQTIFELLNKDIYIENNFEIGIKDNILIKNKYPLSSNCYYSLRFATRDAKAMTITSKEQTKPTKIDVLDKEWYVDPLTLGGGINIIGISLNVKMTLSSKEIFFKYNLGYKNKFIKAELELSNAKTPLIYTKYKCFDSNLREHTFKKSNPMYIYTNISGYANIKDILSLNPNMILKFSTDDHFFKQDTENITKNIATPTRNRLLLVHFYGNLNTKIKIIKYIYTELVPAFNIKSIITKDPGRNTTPIITDMVTDNVPFFTLYGKLYFYKNLDKKSGELATGLEVIFKTPHYANSYDSVLQQYFEQYNPSGSRFKIYPKPSLSCFFNVKIGNFIGSFKLNIINTFWDGYSLASQYYPNDNEYYMISLQYLFM